MKKIMFSDKYGLTAAVLSGRKTQTRRIITCPREFKGEWVAGFHVYRRQSDGAITTYPCMYDADERDFDGGYIMPKYKVGEVVAVAQSYKDAGYSKYALNRAPKTMEIRGHMEESAGWNNKMFVRAEACKNRIRITNVRVERLQDISDGDCIKEGLVQCDDEICKTKCYLIPECRLFHCGNGCEDPREAYAALIDKISGRGTWERNPWVFVYDFELVK